MINERNMRNPVLNGVIDEVKKMANLVGNSAPEVGPILGKFVIGNV